jgi:hypothetical protein
MQTINLKMVGSYAFAYTMWILSFLSWLLFMILGRTSIQTVLAIMYDQTVLKNRLNAGLIDRVFMLATGTIWVILMVVVEEYLRRGVKKGDLYRRTARVFAPIILMIFVADFTMAYAIGFEYSSPGRLVLLVVELLSAIGLFWFGRKKSHC